MRKTEFANDEYYHIYNRGVGKQEVFCCEKDYKRFIVKTRELNNNLNDSQRDYIKRTASKNSKLKSKPGFGYPKPGFDFNLEFYSLVEIICYCLNPNHYHFILKQLVDGGITQFMHKLGTSYAKFFNIKYDHSGWLFISGTI